MKEIEAIDQEILKETNTTFKGTNTTFKGTNTTFAEYITYKVGNELLKSHDPDQILLPAVEQSFELFLDEIKTRVYKKGILYTDKIDKTNINNIELINQIITTTWNELKNTFITQPLAIHNLDAYLNLHMKNCRKKVYNDDWSGNFDTIKSIKNKLSAYLSDLPRNKKLTLKNIPITLELANTIYVEASANNPTILNLTTLINKSITTATLTNNRNFKNTLRELNDETVLKMIKSELTLLRKQWMDELQDNPQQQKTLLDVKIKIIDGLLDNNNFQDIHQNLKDLSEMQLSTLTQETTSIHRLADQKNIFSQALKIILKILNKRLEGVKQLEWLSKLTQNRGEQTLKNINNLREEYWDNKNEDILTNTKRS